MKLNIFKKKLSPCCKAKILTPKDHGWPKDVCFACGANLARYKL